MSLFGVRLIYIYAKLIAKTMSNMKNYIQLPDFLKGKISLEKYQKWLKRKARAHFRRDKIRKYSGISVSKYQTSMHKAVIQSGGYDEYTGERLAWKKISKWNNEDAGESGKKYKKKYYDLPTIDHEFIRGKLVFKICSWQTNDCKNDLSLNELIKFCKKIIKHN